jgi:hypothetical protein
MIAAADIATRTIPLECIDKLHQLQDELHVVWMAFEHNSVDNGNGSLSPVIETIYGIMRRLECVLGSMETASARPTVRSKADPKATDPDTATELLAAMSLEQLHQAYTGLSTILDVASGILCQPRYQAEDDLNEAGKLLNLAIVDAVERILERVVEIAKTLPANDSNSRGRKFGLLASMYVDGRSDPAHCANEIGRIASSLEGELHTAGGRA